MLENTEPGQERDLLDKKLEETEKRWKDVEERTIKRGDDLDKLYPASQKLKDDTLLFSVWLMDAEKKKDRLDSEPLSSDKDIIAVQNKELEVIFYFLISS